MTEPTSPHMVAATPTHWSGLVLPYDRVSEVGRLIARHPIGAPVQLPADGLPLLVRDGHLVAHVGTATEVELVGQDLHAQGRFDTSTAEGLAAAVHVAGHPFTPVGLDLSHVVATTYAIPEAGEEPGVYPFGGMIHVVTAFRLVAIALHLDNTTGEWPAAGISVDWHREQRWRSDVAVDPERAPFAWAQHTRRRAMADVYPGEAPRADL